MIRRCVLGGAVLGISLQAAAQCVSPGGTCPAGITSVLFGFCGATGGYGVNQTAVDTDTTGGISGSGASVPQAGTLVGWCVYLASAGSSGTGHLSFHVWRQSGGSWTCVGTDGAYLTILLGAGNNCFPLASPIPVEAGDQLGVDVATQGAKLWLYGPSGSGSITSTSPVAGCATWSSATTTPTALQVWAQLCPGAVASDGGGPSQDGGDGGAAASDASSGDGATDGASSAGDASQGPLNLTFGCGCGAAAAWPALLAGIGIVAFGRRRGRASQETGACDDGVSP